MPRKQKKRKADPKPRAFVARPCTACMAVREPATNYSRVYSTKGRIRYCKCDFCGNTWTQTISADQINTVVVNRTDAQVEKRLANSKDDMHGNRTVTTKSNRRRD